MAPEPKGDTAITLAAPDPALRPRQPRARGETLLTSKLRDGKSVIADLRQSGAAKLLFPAHRPHLEAILVNTAGGLTGGDSFRTEAHAGDGTHVTLTTQAAERAYRAQPGETARVATRLTAGENATLHWLPQELILYDGASLDRRLEIALTPSARLLMVEAMIFGRAAMGERIATLAFADRIAIDRAGRPLYRDGLRLTPETLARPALVAGMGAMASLVYAAPGAEDHLAPLRAHLPETGGATLLAPGLLALRLLAPDSLALRRALLPVLDRLTSDTLPVSWRL